MYIYASKSCLVSHFSLFHWKFTISYSKHQSNNKEWAYYHTAYFKYTHHLCLWFSVTSQKLARVATFWKFWIGLPEIFTSLHHISTEPHGGQWLILTSNFYVHGNKIQIIFFFTEPKWGPVELFSRIEPEFWILYFKTLFQMLQEASFAYSFRTKSMNWFIGI